MILFIFKLSEIDITFKSCAQTHLCLADWDETGKAVKKLALVPALGGSWSLEDHQSSATFYRIQ